MIFRPTRTALVALLFSVFPLSAVFAVPAKKGVFTISQPDGTTIDVRLTGDEHSFYYTTPCGTPLESVDGFLRPVERGSALPLRRMPAQRAEGLFPGSDFPCHGEQKVLVVLVEYTDVKFLSDYNPNDYFTRLLNEEGFTDNDATGSARDYFIDNSKGLFKPQFDVYGPVTLPHPQSYYGGNGPMMPDVHGCEMVIDACAILDDEVDFSQYDRNGDGLIDNVFIYYAGRGEASGGGEDCVWPHSALLRSLRPNQEPIMHDGVELNRYACTNERQSNVPDGIGTFVHEFSHVMGLPDLYATSANQTVNESFTPGSWSVMDYGPYNNNSHTPPYYSAFELAALGWLEPTIIDGETSVRLEDISHGEAYKIVNPGRANEYFLFENRQRHDWDSYIPGHGMLVWHIDYDPTVWTGNVVNNTPNHQYVDLIEADGRPTATTRDGDSFPGAAQVRSFTDNTNPSMTFWNGRGAGLPITEITERDGVISFKVGAGCEAPDAVAALAATDVVPTGFTANWVASKEATSYLLTVLAGGTAVEGFERLNVGKTTSYKVGNLLPDTQYSYYVNVVTGYGESEPSNSVSVTTAMLPMAERRPVALAATEVSATAFTANWRPESDADSYALSVYTKLAGDPIAEEYDFTGYPETMPAGWNSSTLATYSMGSMAGAAIPSLRMNNTGDYIATPVCDDGIKTLSFWTRASSGTEGSIEVTATTPDGEKTVYTAAVTNDADGLSTIISSLPDACSRLTVTFVRTSERGSLALDDIRITHGNELTRVYAQGYENLSTETTSARIEGLEAGKTYYYNVKALAGNVLSLESNEIEVASSSAVTAPVAEGAVSMSGRRICYSGVGTASVCDIAGHKVAAMESGASIELVSPGFYIVSFGENAVKIFVK